MNRIGSMIVLLVFSTVARAADWPQWLGPTRDGVSSEKVAPWKDAPKVLWRQAVGEGNSSPVVAEGRVFIHAKIKDKDEEEVTAFDAKSGKELWRATYARDKFQSLYGNGPRATPAVADGRVYTFGITGILTCFEAASGKQLWQVDMLKKFEAKNLFFGVSCSPLVEGDKVLVAVGGKEATIVALSKDKGEVVWKGLLTWKGKDDKEVQDRASYASPIVFGQGKQRQLVFLTQQGVVSLSPTDGSTFWQVPLVDKLFESSTTPVRVGDLLVASSITFGSLGLRLETKNDKPAASEVWKNAALTCYFSTPVPVGNEHVYLVTGTPGLPGTVHANLRCIEAKTGKQLWEKAKIGEYHAALLRTADNKLLMLDDTGNLTLLDPDPKEYRELARSKVCGKTWAHPALSDGRLYVRDDKELICLQLKE